MRCRLAVATKARPDNNIDLLLYKTIKKDYNNIYLFYIKFFIYNINNYNLIKDRFNYKDIDFIIIDILFLTIFINYLISFIT